MLKFIKWLVVVGFINLFIFSCLQKEKPNLEYTIRRYIAASNAHDIAALKTMMTEDVIWYLGPDTLVGINEVIKPYEFDEGANTALKLSNIKVKGDTVEFDLLEKNDVLTALGVPELHHFPRVIFRENLISLKKPRRPPLEIEAFRDSVISFRRWFRENYPDKYDQIWHEGKFNYSKSTAELLLQLHNERRNKLK